jgi:DNA-binding MarR family transcriptional regulator
VPLFLSLVQSTLLSKIFDADRLDGKTSIPYSEFLIFTGICIVAAISARKFLDTVSDKVVRDVNRLERKTDGIGQQAAVAQVKAVEAAEKAESASLILREIADEQAVEARNEPLDQDSEFGTDASGIDLSLLERAALANLTQVTFRTATGIGQVIGIPRAQVSDLIDSLAVRKLIERTTSPTTGGPRWRITPLGVSALR